MRVMNDRYRRSKVEISRPLLQSIQDICYGRVARSRVTEELPISLILTKCEFPNAQYYGIMNVHSYIIQCTTY